MKIALTAVVGALAVFAAVAVAATTAAPAAPAPTAATYDAAQYDSGGRLLFPADYRRWVFLSSGSDMSYSPQAMAGRHMFDNSFVDPAAYDAFIKTAHWPDGSIFIIEVRRGETKGSITQSGIFQSGAPLAWEVHVKDSKRFPTGWGFFSFNGPAPATLIPAAAGCYSCHQAHAAVDTTFMQFYPTLLPIAQKAGVISPAYLKELAALQAQPEAGGHPSP